jgi:hypothetical protein
MQANHLLITSPTLIGICLRHLGGTPKRGDVVAKTLLAYKQCALIVGQ